MYLNIYRYNKSGFYRDFMERIGNNLVANELQIQPENIYLWKVYTDVDFTLKAKHTDDRAFERQEKKGQDKSCKRKRKCRFLLSSTENL